MVYKTADALEGALGNAFLSLIDGSKSASEAMKDFAKSVLQSMAQIAANQIAAQILTGIGGFFYWWRWWSNYTDESTDNGCQTWRDSLKMLQATDMAQIK